MRAIPPIYHAGPRVYGIDSCEPQRRAIEAGKIEFHALTHGHYPGQPIPKRLLPGLNSIGHWSAVGAQDWGLEPHRNEGVEFVWLETGAMAFEVDGRRHRLQAGDLTITRPWQLHRLGDPHIGPGRLHWLIVDVGVRRPNQDWRWPSWVVITRADREELSARLRGNEHPVWRATPDLRHSFGELARGVEAFAPSQVSRMIIHLNHLLLSLLDALRRQAPGPDPALSTRRRTVELFLRDLEENPESLSHPWTVASMAEHCGMGETAFSGHCRDLANASPADYLRDCRIDRAAELLRRDAGRSVTDIALDCGFNTSQYFATCFRRRKGCTPGEWRRRA